MIATHAAKIKTIIRRPREDDIERLLAIEQRCFRAHRFTREDFDYHFSNPSSIFAVAESSQEVTGYIAGVVYHGSKHRIAKLYSMAVLSKWRNHGIGSELLMYFEREASRRDCGSVTLEVRKSNRTAQALYRRFGYQTEEVLPDYYAPGSDGLRMRTLITHR